MTEKQFDFVAWDFVTHKQEAKEMSDKEKTEALERKVDLLAQSIATLADTHGSLLGTLSKIMGHHISVELNNSQKLLGQFIENLSSELELIDKNNDQ